MTLRQDFSLGTAFAMFLFPTLGLVAVLGFGYEWYRSGAPDIALLVLVVVPTAAFGAAYLYRWLAIGPATAPPRGTTREPGPSQLLAEIRALEARVAQLEAGAQHVVQASPPTARL